MPNLTLAVVMVGVAVWLPALPSAAQTSPVPSAVAEDAAAETADRPGRHAPALGSPQAVLKEARDNLVGYRSIRARLSQVVSLGERRFRASGSYLQGANLRLRLEYRVQVGESTATLLEVCDGQRLWSRHDLDGQTRVTLRDVRQILEAARTGGADVKTMLLAELGLGGLPALLASISESMTFDSVREEVIDESQPPLIVIEGTWNDQLLNQWRGGKEDAPLPAHIPDAVRVYFDQKTLFPRRILYLKRPSPREAARPMVTFDLVDVMLNAPVNDDEFYFVPPDGVLQEDITRAYLDRIRAATEAAPKPLPRKLRSRGDR